MRETVATGKARLRLFEDEPPGTKLLTRMGSRRMVANIATLPQSAESHSHMIQGPHPNRYLIPNLTAEIVCLTSTPGTVMGAPANVPANVTLRVPKS